MAKSVHKKVKMFHHHSNQTYMFHTKRCNLKINTYMKWKKQFPYLISKAVLPNFLQPRHTSFIHSGHFYSAPSSPLLPRGAPDYSTDTVSEFHAKAHRQLQVKDLPKVPTWRLERESNPWPCSWKSSSQQRRHHVPHLFRTTYQTAHRIQWRAEAVGCPGQTRFLDALENTLYSSRKISDDLF